MSKIAPWPKSESDATPAAVARAFLVQASHDLSWLADPDQSNDPKDTAIRAGRLLPQVYLAHALIHMVAADSIIADQLARRIWQAADAGDLIGDDLDEAMGWVDLDFDAVYAEYEASKPDASPKGDPPAVSEEKTTGHGYTSHGHPCCGSAAIGGRPKAVARCGGPILCSACRSDVAQVHAGPRSWSLDAEPGPEVTRLTTPADDELIIQRGPCPTGVHGVGCWSITRGGSRWKRCETWRWLLAEYVRLVDATPVAASPVSDKEGRTGE